MSGAVPAVPGRRARRFRQHPAGGGDTRRGQRCDGSRGAGSNKRRKNERNAAAGPWSGQDSRGSVEARKASWMTTGHHVVASLPFPASTSRKVIEDGGSAIDGGATARAVRMK